ncbi:MAG: DUF4202 family protein [Nanoarchaeota archaeon]
MNEFFNKVEKFVKESFIKIGQERQIKHFERTVYWIKELNPKCDEALLISAIAHDIERAYRTKEQYEKINEVGFTHPEFFRPHEEKGAEIIAEFLNNQKANQILIKRVKELISRHEEGGNEDQNLLKDADSLSFLENNVYPFLKRVKERGKDKIREKIDWMYNRISSQNAKQIAKIWYEKAIKDLEAI